MLWHINSLWRVFTMSCPGCGLYEITWANIILILSLYKIKKSESQQRDLSKVRQLEMRPLQIYSSWFGVFSNTSRSQPSFNIYFQPYYLTTPKVSGFDCTLTELPWLVCIAKSFWLGQCLLFRFFLKNLNTSDPDMLFRGGILKIIQE